MPTHRLLALTLALTAAGCDSSAQLVATRTAPPVAQTLSATQSVTAIGSTTVTAYLFNRADLPDTIVNGGNPRLVLGTHASPLVPGQLPGTLSAALPPQTMPPVPDSQGTSVVGVQSDAASRLIRVRFTPAVRVVGPATSSL